ncbi:MULTISPECIES: hypothetical protein [unclassified Cryobacterium]|uniref:hypothetical protein n=1 Tax=unclassified Cryobacterium TaxID=2649013 RepID=UPI00141AE0EA|nr:MULTISPECIES: hypothetical protein [unclassified Cryobacterium]
MINKAALLAHIKAKAEHPKPIVYAVLTGLAMAIERGDFDEPGPGTTPDLPNE